MTYKKRAENAAKNLLQRKDIRRGPVDVLKIAKEEGLEVKEYDLGDVSGVLHINKNKGIIGYNPKHSSVRQRFTVAHELGHYILHRHTDDIFVDNNFHQVHFRDDQSSTGEVVKELEANAFAAALLMPEDLIKQEVENHHFDLADESAFIDLAKLFKVSVQAMTYRISNLNLL
ncbi:MAG TPA: ImmA/IrrE family metallo-endopeptidase [Cyclobacteriaceae bacterium]|nr:ImmA/IrrE family metallo-endopeptidase [Cyclobacteriaceae bacterium]